MLYNLMGDGANIVNQQFQQEVRGILNHINAQTEIMENDFSHLRKFHADIEHEII